jgi:Protein of unknown function (DUF3309)
VKSKTELSGPIVTMKFRIRRMFQPSTSLAPAADVRGRVQRREDPGERVGVGVDPSVCVGSGERSQSDFGLLENPVRQAEPAALRPGTNAALPAVPEDPSLIGTILVILLILMLLGALPNWGYSNGWGYFPSGTIGAIVIVVIVLALTGRL